MKPGEGRSSGRIRPPRSGWLFVAAFLAGCASHKAHLERAMVNKVGATTPDARLAEGYRIGCSDEVVISVGQERDGPQPVAPDGRVRVPSLGPVRIEGYTASEAAQVLASYADVSPDSVKVQVTAHRSQLVYIFGEVPGLQQAVAYQGPEPVVDLLRRVGGLNPGAAPGEIHVVRSRVVDGKAPQVFHVDLAEILGKHDEATNVRLHPFDQVYVGRSRQCVIRNGVPPWLQPVYDSASGWKK